MNNGPFELGRTIGIRLRNYLNGQHGSGTHFLPGSEFVRELDLGDFLQALHDLGKGEVGKGAALVQVDSEAGFGAGVSVRGALHALLQRVVDLEGGGGGGLGDIRQEVTVVSASLGSTTTLLLLSYEGASVAMGVPGNDNRKVVVIATLSATLTSTGSVLHQIDGSFSSSFTLSAGNSYTFRAIGGKWRLTAG